jgi:hypothetical protein
MPNKPVVTIPAFVFVTGQEPVSDQVDAAGARTLRGWQQRAYDALREHALRICVAPTGSGKSTLIKALAADELRRDPRNKVIVAVPQCLIARSFAASSILVNGTAVAWDADNYLINTRSNVDELCDFVCSEPGDSAEARTMVCTQQTLVLAFERLVEAGAEWSGVGLYIDEAHHSSDDNRLGAVVLDWLDKKRGSVWLGNANASWRRPTASVHATHPALP